MNQIHSPYFPKAEQSAGGQVRMLDGTCEIKYNLTHIGTEVKGEFSEKMFFPMGVRLHSSIFAHRFFRSDYQ